MESRSASSTILPRAPAYSGIPGITANQAARTSRSEVSRRETFDGYDETREQGCRSVAQPVIPVAYEPDFVRIRLHRIGPGVPKAECLTAVAEELNLLVHRGLPDVVKQSGSEAGKSSIGRLAVSMISVRVPGVADRRP